MSVFVEGMGVATGIAFDRERNLYVGDRSGTIFKIARDRQIFVDYHPTMRVILPSPDGPGSVLATDLLPGAYRWTP